MIRSDDVEDLVQESFVKAWKNFHQFQHGSSFRTWIYRIAMNTCYDYLKKKKPDYLSDVSEQVVGEDSLSDRDLIDRALLGLSPKMREVFILYYKFNYKLNEIASMLDCSEGTVKSRLYKAKEIFSKFVEQNGGYRE
jgi:RNA polymerase sigma-70 factor (ECF subfamily)